jgi:MFS transporter, SP family, arabinose:H+ symporter
MQIPLPLPRDRNDRLNFPKPAKGTWAYAMQFRKTGRSSAAGSRRDVALWLIDRAGRKTLILAGTALQFVFFAAVGWLYCVHGSGVAILIFVMTFIAGHAVGNGVACWVIISEIYPTKVRGRAMSIATTALWLVGYLGNQLFRVMQKNLGSHGTFWCFSAGALLTIILVGLLVPETKGRSLEEITEVWAPRTALSSSMHSS